MLVTKETAVLSAIVPAHPGQPAAERQRVLPDQDREQHHDRDHREARARPACSCGRSAPRRGSRPGPDRSPARRGCAGSGSAPRPGSRPAGRRPEPAGRAVRRWSAGPPPCHPGPGSSEPLRVDQRGEQVDHEGDHGDHQGGGSKTHGSSIGSRGDDQRGLDAIAAALDVVLARGRSAAATIGRLGVRVASRRLRSHGSGHLLEAWTPSLLGTGRPFCCFRSPCRCWRAWRSARSGPVW